MCICVCECEWIEVLWAVCVKTTGAPLELEREWPIAALWCTEAEELLVNLGWVHFCKEDDELRD